MRTPAARLSPSYVTTTCCHLKVETEAFVRSRSFLKGEPESIPNSHRRSAIASSGPVRSSFPDTRAIIDESFNVVGKIQVDHVISLSESHRGRPSTSSRVSPSKVSAFATLPSDQLRFP